MRKQGGQGRSGKKQVSAQSCETNSLTRGYLRAAQPGWKSHFLMFFQTCKMSLDSQCSWMEKYYLSDLESLEKRTWKNHLISSLGLNMQEAEKEHLQTQVLGNSVGFGHEVQVPVSQFQLICWLPSLGLCLLHCIRQTHFFLIVPSGRLFG